MLDMTREWVSKAEGDYDVVLLLLRSRKPSRRDAIAFHCQQCAEKYLKAILTEESIRFPKTHDLFELLEKIVPLSPGGPGWETHSARFRIMPFCRDIRACTRKRSKQSGLS